MNKATFAGRRCDQTVNRRAVCRGAGDDRDGGAIGQSDAGKADDRNVERGEVGTKARVDAVVVIGPQARHGTIDDGFSGKDKRVAGVDRIDQCGADGLTDPHGKMLVNLHREGSPRRKRYRGALAPCGRAGE